MMHETTANSTANNKDILDYLDKKFEQLDVTFVEKIKVEIKEERKSLFVEHENRISKLEPTVSMLQEKIQLKTVRKN